MKNREVLFIAVAVLVMCCLTLAGPGAANKPDDLYDDFQTFSRMVATISANYVEKVDTQKLFYGAYDGMFNSLDPYSAFLPPAQKEELEIETKGEFGGLGIEITLDKAGILTVVSPLEDSPAFKAGVLAGDRIVRIEGKSTKGLALPDAVKKLRGPKGTPVTITVYHENGKSEDLTVVRDTIELESIKDASIIDEKAKIAYLRLTQFQANSADSLDKAVEDLQKKGMKALVLDLRFNPGGLLPSAIDIADRFIAEGVIVSTKGRRSPEQIHAAKKEGTYANFPLALLISGRSASASEILAGAVQDHKRGILVGTRTFGKGSVQSVLKFEDGKSAIRLTTAYYYTPSGRLIHRNPNNPDQKTWGIDPDIEIPVTFQDEIDLWNHWRDVHLKEIKDKNGGKKPDKPDDTKKDEPKKDEPAPKPPAPPDDEELVPPPAPDKSKDDKPKEFHDRTLEAAVNALKGMILVREEEKVEPGVPAAK